MESHVGYLRGAAGTGSRCNRPLLAVEILLMTTPPPDWFSTILAFLNVRSGRPLLAAFALALAGMILLIILYAPGQVAETHLAPIRRDLAGWGGHILIYTLVFVAFVVVLLVWHCWNRRKNMLARRETEAQTLAHLDALPDDERHILRQCVLRGYSSFRADSLGGYSIVRDEVLNRLAAKRLVEFRFWDSIYTIPQFVWVELRRRCESTVNRR